MYICDQYKYSLDESGNATIAKYKGNARELTVPDTLDGHTVVAIWEEAFYDCKFLKSITLPSSLTSIGDSAFRYCDSLTLTVPRNSYAAQYAEAHKIPYQYPDVLDWLNN